MSAMGALYSTLWHFNLTLISFLADLKRNPKSSEHLLDIPERFIDICFHVRGKL